MIKVTLTIALLLSIIQAIGQPFTPELNNIKLIQPPSIGLLLEEHKDFLHKVESVPGYRIQIRTFTRLQEGTNALNAFERTFPDVQAYLLFIEPHYRLRAGDFLDRVEANRVMHKLRSRYPECFIVKDEVRLDAL
jgi:hypothetical protein